MFCSMKTYAWFLVAFTLSPLVVRATDIETHVYCQIFKVDVIDTVPATLTHVTSDLNAQKPMYICTAVYKDNSQPSYYRLDYDDDSSFIQEQNTRLQKQKLYIKFPVEWIIEENEFPGVLIEAGSENSLIVAEQDIPKYDENSIIATGARLLQNNRKLRKTKAKEKTLLVAVSTIDSSPTMSTGMIESRFVEARQQIFKCSDRSLKMPLYETIDVLLERSIGTYNHLTIFQKAAEAVNNHYGFVPKTDPALALGIDHIIYVVPVGLNTDRHTFGFAYAAIGGSYSVYQGPSYTREVVIHEIGHNFGLSHAREDLLTMPDGDFLENAEYGDDTGQMGTSFYLSNRENDGYKRCFNGANFDEMGWYTDYTVAANLDAQNDVKIFKLVSFVDRPRMQQDQVINIKVGTDYFVTFNRKKRFNKRTKESIDDVIVVKRLANGGTDMMASLVTSGFGSKIFMDGTNMIEVCGRGKVGLVNFVEVAVGLNKGCP